MNTHDDDARPPAVRHAAIGEQAWRDAADAQLSAEPNHTDFYELAGSLSPTLIALMDVATILQQQVAHYGDGRVVYDDTRTVDPAQRLAQAADKLAALRTALFAAHAHTERYWSAIAHIGVEVTR